MGIRSRLNDLFTHSAKSLQSQAEIREGIANLSTLINQRMREEIAQQENAANRMERLLTELTTSITNQTEIMLRLAERVQSLESAQGPRTVSEEQADVSIAPVVSLAMPQFSLRRSNPIADLMATKEFRAYVDFFGGSPSTARSTLSPAEHGLIYAFGRKLRPDCALIVASDGATTAETMARAVLGNGQGQVYLVDVAAELARSVVAAWPRALRSLVTVAADMGELPSQPIGLAYVGSEIGRGPARIAFDKLFARKPELPALIMGHPEVLPDEFANLSIKCAWLEWRAETTDARNVVALMPPST